MHYYDPLNVNLFECYFQYVTYTQKNSPNIAIACDISNLLDNAELLL
jgi:hypothetical protein